MDRQKWTHRERFARIRLHCPIRSGESCYNALLFSQTRLPLCEWKIRSVFRCLSVLMEIDACNLSKSPARNCARD